MNLEIHKLNIQFKGISEIQAREIVSELGSEIINQISSQETLAYSPDRKVEVLNAKSIKIQRDTNSSIIRKKMANGILSQLNKKIVKINKNYSK
jgi:hypothetical protein